MIESAYMDKDTGGEFQLHDGASCFLTRFDLGTPQVRSTVAAAPQRHGIHDVTNYYGERTIALSGEVFASSGSSLWSTVDEFKAATRVGVPHALTFRREGLAYDEFVNCRVAGPLTMSATAGGAHHLLWGMTLVCPDPRIYGEAISSTGMDPNSSDTVTNAGNISSPATITLTGPINSGSEIVNVTTGKTITLATSLASGAAVTLDTGARTLTFLGLLNMSYIDASDTEWWELEPGDNDLEWNGSGTSGVTNWEIHSTDARL